MYSSPPCHLLHRWFTNAGKRQLSAQEQEYVIQLVRLLLLASGHRGHVQRHCRCFRSRHHFTPQLVDNRAVSFHDVCPLGVLATEDAQPAKRSRIHTQPTWKLARGPLRPKSRHLRDEQSFALRNALHLSDSSLFELCHSFNHSSTGGKGQ